MIEYINIQAIISGGIDRNPDIAGLRSPYLPNAIRAWFIGTTCCRDCRFFQYFPDVCKPISFLVGGNHFHIKAGVAFHFRSKRNAVNRQLSDNPEPSAPALFRSRHVPSLPPWAFFLRSTVNLRPCFPQTY